MNRGVNPLFPAPEIGGWRWRVQSFVSLQPFPALRRFPCGEPSNLMISCTCSCGKLLASFVPRNLVFGSGCKILLRMNSPFRYLLREQLVMRRNHGFWSKTQPPCYVDNQASCIAADLLPVQAMNDALLVFRSAVPK